MTTGAAARKTIKVRCATWDQVEAFYTEKLRGNAVVVKMPYRPELGERIAVALGLPDGLVFAIDGDVVKVGADEPGGRVPVALRLVGMGTGVREQLERLVSAARSVQASPTPAPEPEPSVDEAERAEVAALEAELARRKPLPAHELLGVAADAPLVDVRKAYLEAAKKHHPDARGRFRTPSTRGLIAEIFIGIARAYDRLRETAVAPIRVPGPAFSSRAPWLIALEPESSGVVAVPVQAESSSPYSEIQLGSGRIPTTDPNYLGDAPPRVGEEGAPVSDFNEEFTFNTPVKLKALTAEELFDDDAVTHADVARPDPSAVTAPLMESGRAALAAARWRDACEAFAAALRVDPRDRVVRALYHVASGYEMRDKGDGARAQLQFETALAHNPDSDEARRALTQLPRGKGTRIY